MAVYCVSDLQKTLLLMKDVINYVWDQMKLESYKKNFSQPTFICM